MHFFSISAIDSGPGAVLGSSDSGPVVFHACHENNDIHTVYIMNICMYVCMYACTHV